MSGKRSSQMNPYLKTAKEGYFPTWSHLLRRIKGCGVYGCELITMTGEGRQLLGKLDANFAVVTLPGLFSSSSQNSLVAIQIRVIHPHAGVMHVHSLWATRRGGFFKERALPDNELLREIFLTHYLEEIENGRN